MKKNTLTDKRYYSIGEVSRMTGLEQYVLRYWEKEFPVLKPRKNRGGNRLYTSKDIEIVNRINHLRHKEGLTIAGTRTKLMMRRPSEEKTDLVNKAKAQSALARIRKDIEDLLKLFS
ncbi:MAG: MerR family transcriptional regulator [candidate division Zixibacteria bacterium]|nr:MerR family transcriptional regulator [candidate division Zixibacteria bacterium]